MVSVFRAKRRLGFWVRLGLGWGTEVRDDDVRGGQMSRGQVS